MLHSNIKDFLQIYNKENNVVGNVHIGAIVGSAAASESKESSEVFSGEGVTYWDKNYKNMFNQLITDEIASEIGINEINELYISNTDNIGNDMLDWSNLLETMPNIKEVVRTQTGGFSQHIMDNLLSKLNIKIKQIKYNSLPNKKLISLSLFNAKFISKDTPYTYDHKEKKPPHFYTKVLYNALKTYEKYLPDWTIRLYIDNTIPIYGADGTTPDIDSQVSLPDETKAVLNEFLNTENINLELMLVENISFIKNNKHYKLIPVIFRYLSMFDPSVTTCFIGDIDNLCTRHLAEILKIFSTSTSKFLIFKPTSSYSRPYFDNKCIDNFLAGMIGFNKDIDTIINPKIWSCLLKFIDYYYQKLYVETGILKHTKCTTSVTLDSPFYYGFEESGFTTIFAYLINQRALPITTIPLIFEISLIPHEFTGYCLINNIYKYVHNDLLEYISNLIGIKFFQNYKNLCILYSTMYMPIFSVIIQIIHHLYFEKITEITINNKLIQCFYNIDDPNLVSVFNVFPFIGSYPIDFEELEHVASVTLVYGKNISTEILDTVTHFEKSEFQLFEKKIMNVLPKVLIDYTRENYKQNHSAFFNNNIQIYMYVDKLFFNNIPLDFLLMPIDKINIENWENILSNIVDITNIDVFKNQYDNVISLGSHSFFSNALFKLRLIDEELPFDNILNINIKDLVDLFNDNLNNLAGNPNTELYQKNGPVMMNTKYNSIKMPLSNSITEASVNKLRELNLNERKKLYIFTQRQNLSYNLTEYVIELYKDFSKISKNIKNSNILVILLSDQTENGLKVILNGNNEAKITLLLLSSKTIDAIYDNKKKRKVYDNILKNIKITSPDSRLLDGNYNLTKYLKYKYKYLLLKDKALKNSN